MTTPSIAATKFLSPTQLSNLWSYHPESIRRMIREGRLPAIRIGKRLRVSLADIEAYEASNCVLSASADTKGGVR